MKSKVEIKCPRCEKWFDIKEINERYEREWISVKDDLPKSDKKVLVYPHSGLIGHYTVHTTKKWIYGNLDIVVTHWMEKPEPPK